MKFKYCIYFILLSATAAMAQEQKWPKLMQLFEGRIVEVRYDNTVGFWYLDWMGKVIPEMTMNYNDKTAKYLYVDSTGKAINDARYDDAYPFNGGIALVSSPGRYVYETPRSFAIINEKSEYVFPFSTEPKFNIGNGFLFIEKANQRDVFDRFGKKITECEGCEIETNTQMKQIIMNPPNQNKNGRPVKLLDFEGRILFSRSGTRLSQISNDISTRLGTYSTMQAYYQLSIDAENNLSAIISQEGKVVLDSINYSFFSRGKSCILKNKIASVVDTNFKTLMPYSYGYDFYRPMDQHPEEAYCARKDGKYVVINAANKILAPISSTYTEIWYKPEMNVYEGRNEEGGFWYMTLSGDTIGSPLKYREVASLEPILPGYFVKPKLSDSVGYMSNRGDLVIPCHYTNLLYGGKNLILYFRNGEAGYMDLNGKLKFKIENALTLSAFIAGYAQCGIKITQRDKQSPSAQSVYTGQESYQVQNKLIDSTGKFVSEECFDWLNVLKDGYANVIKNNDTYMVDKNLKKILVNGNCQLMTYFYKGTAMAYDPKKNTWGVVNEKLEVIVPIIYTSIETKEEEGGRYTYYATSANGSENGGGFTNYYANIKDGKLKVTNNKQEQIITLVK